MAETVVRLKPLTYVHIHDNNINTSQVLCGPATYTLQQHQSLLTPQPKDFVAIPNESYAIIENPVVRMPDGSIKKDKHGQPKINLGEREVRFHQLPFPLYPGEVLVEARPLMVLKPSQAVVLRAIRTFITEDHIEHVAGDEFLFEGPGTYVPRVEEEIVEKRDAVIVKFNESLKLRAKNKFVDPTGVERNVGEEYLWTKPGAYMLKVDEQLLSVVPSITLTTTKAIHVECTSSFLDTRPWAKNIERRAGQVYLVTNRDTPEFTPLPSERVQKEVALVVVTARQFAVVLDPVENGVPQFGRRKVVNDCSFFLQPGERLESGTRDLYVLSADEALLLCATEEFEDHDVSPPVMRVAGELWLLTGPRQYFPPASARVVKSAQGNEKRTRLVLPDGDGVYVRNTLTGEVRLLTGCTYMLSATEELWEKTVPKAVESQLIRQGLDHSAYLETASQTSKKLDRTRAVKYLVPHNSITQVYDYKKRTQRTVFGPELVLLGPEEQFTVLSLSGSDWDPKQPYKCLPKKPHKIQALYLFLGPSTLWDVLHVETADHARLALQLAYSWHFAVEPGNTSQANECFKIPDFVGDLCSCVASRIRASVASFPFKQFHTQSSTIVQNAVFGIDKRTGQRKPELHFPNNRLVVTSVDIQEIEVLDEVTREALQRSVKMAIEITTQTQEAAAQHQASVREQQARGRLERQMIEDKASNEIERKKVIEHETKTSSIESTGQAKAEARARAEAAQIEGNLKVTVARIKANTSVVMDQMQNKARKNKAELQLTHRAEIDALELERSKSLAEIESGKFKRMMAAVGTETVQALAKAGPELQARLLKGLGIEGFLITDGQNPINLFTTANGLAGGAQASSAPQ